MPSDIFDFLQSDWLQQRAAFYDILTVVQKSYFLATNRGVKSVFKLKTLPKSTIPIDTSAKPEMYFSRTKLRNNKYRHQKALASAHQNVRA